MARQFQEESVTGALTCLVCEVNCTEGVGGLSFLPTRSSHDGGDGKDDHDKENSSIFQKFCREFLHIRKLQLEGSLSLCPKCRDNLSCVMETKKQMVEVEVRVQSLQLSLLEELKGLQEFVDVLEGQLKQLEVAVRKSNSDGEGNGGTLVTFGGKKMLRMKRGQLKPVEDEGGEGGSVPDDAAIFRKSLSEVTSNMRTFRRDLNTRFYSSADGEIEVTVKTEPDDTHFNLYSPSQPLPGDNLEEVDDDEEDFKLSHPLQGGNSCRKRYAILSESDDDDDHHHHDRNEDCEEEPSPAFEGYLEQPSKDYSASSKFLDDLLEPGLGLHLPLIDPPSPSSSSSLSSFSSSSSKSRKQSHGKKTTLSKKIISREFISSDSYSSDDGEEADADDTVSLDDIPLSLRMRMRRRKQSPGKMPSSKSKRRRVTFGSPVERVTWGENNRSSWPKSPSPENPERNGKEELLKVSGGNSSKSKLSLSDDSSSSSSNCSTCSSSSSSSEIKRRKRKESRNLSRKFISSDSDSDVEEDNGGGQRDIEGGPRRRPSSLKAMKKIKENVIISGSDEEADDNYEPETEPDDEVEFLSSNDRTLDKPNIRPKKRQRSWNPTACQIDFTGMSDFRKFVIRNLVNKSIIRLAEESLEEAPAPNTPAYYLRQVEQERMSTCIEYNPENSTIHVKNVEIRINELDHSLECSQCPYKMEVVPWPVKALKDRRHFSKFGKRRFRSHIISNHHPTDFTCPVCPVSNGVQTRYKLRTFIFHLKSHMDMHSITCTICGKPIRHGGSDLKVHLLSHMSQEERIQAEAEDGAETLHQAQLSRMRTYQRKRKDDRILCTVCGNYVRKSYFNTHMRKVCGSLPRVKCNSCDKTFKCKEGMERHTRKTHSKEAEERPYHCHMCPGRFKAKENLTVHLEIHSEERIYQCGKGCGKDFARKRYWKSHEAKCKGPRPQAQGKRGRTQKEELTDPLDSSDSSNE